MMSHYYQIMSTMKWTKDRIMDVIFWGFSSFLVATVISHLDLHNFWITWITTWITSAGSFLYLSQIKLPVEDKAVLITGCDTGIGHALALHLHKLGFRVFAGCLHADTGGEGAEALRRINSSHLQVIQLDVTNDQQIKDGVLQVKKLLPEGEKMLWGLVNNAGVSAFGEVEWVPLDTYKRITDINLFGLINVTRAFLPFVRRAKGRVVNMASVCGHLSRAGMSPYVLSKFGVEGFSDCLRHEMSPWGVDVCIIEPCNYSAGTQITTEESIENQGITMWQSMSEQVRQDYGRDYFNHVVNIAKLLSNSGLRDISPIVEAMEEALTQRYPRARYRPVTLYYLLKVLMVTHMPEWVFSLLYVAKRRISNR